MAIKLATPFSGELPAVPVFKNGITHYCHNQKELDKWTKPEDEGGPGYSRDYVRQEYPKLMSHEGLPDLKVANEKEQKAAEKKGYNFDHFENAKAKSAPKVDGAAAPSFDPKAQALMDSLTKQNSELASNLSILNQAMQTQTDRMIEDREEFEAQSEKRIQSLEQQLAAQSAQFNALMAKLGEVPKVADQSDQKK